MIETESSARVATLTLARARAHNALSAATMHAVADRLDAWREDPDVSVVIIAGEGRSFCAGLDRNELQSDDASVRRAIHRASCRFHRAVALFPKPIVAAVQGHALGTGFDLAVMCDLRLAADDARFGHPEIRLGGVPVCAPLARIVGEGWARRLCLDGTPIDAATARSAGLVTGVVPAGELRAQAMRQAAAIAETPTATLIRTKALFLRHGDPEAWIVTDHDEIFDEGMTIRRAVAG